MIAYGGVVQSSGVRSRSNYHCRDRGWTDKVTLLYTKWNETVLV